MPNRKIKKSSDALVTTNVQEKKEKDRKKHLKLTAVVFLVTLVLGVSGTIIGCGLRNHNISYECQGVDNIWLSSHEFDVSGFQTEYSEFGGVELKTPSIAGYSFKGWYLKEGNIPLVKNVYRGKLFSNKDVVFVAKFEPTIYTIDLELCGGHLAGLENNTYQGHKFNFDEETKAFAHTTFTCLDKPFLLPLCERDGYDFVHNEWKLKDSEAYISAINPSINLRNFSARADWVIHPYSISYTFKGEGVSEFEDEIISNNIHGFDYETSVLFTDPYLEGYTFEGWFDTSDNKITSIKTHTVPKNDVFNVIGKFKPIEYKISYSDRSKTDLSSFPKTFKRCSPDITIPDISPDGYVFNGWVSSNVTTLQYTAKIDHGSVGNITLTAALDLIPYKVAFALGGVDDDFKDSFNLKSKVINYNVESDTFELPEATCTGYDFVNFTDENGDEITEIKKGTTGNIVVTANFTPTQYKITRSYRLHEEDELITLEDKYTIETAQFSLPSPSSDIKTFVGWVEKTTSKLFTPSAKFGRGIIGNYNFEAKWSLNGKGTESEPYQIFTAKQLEDITDMTSYYILMNDITITASKNDAWVPVGNEDAPFNGSFNGNGKTISFVVSAKASENDNYLDYFGLFGFVGKNSNIHNFTLNGSIGSSEERYPTNMFGTVAALCAGTISNINQNVSIYLTNGINDSDVISVGGLVGIGQALTIKSCVVGINEQSILNIDASKTETIECGGVIGETAGGIVSDTVVNINIVSKAYTNSYAGGFLGYRDPDFPTNIELSTVPTSVSPFAGQVSSSAVSDISDIGMLKYDGGKKALIGKEYYTGLKPNATTYKVDHYYYSIVTDGEGLYGMCWIKCIDDLLVFDKEHPINMIEFN